MIDLLRRLSPRERGLVIGAALFITMALVYGLIVDPLITSQSRYHSMALRKRDDLARFRMLAMDYRKMDSSLKYLENKVSAEKSGTSLLATMEAEARKLGLSERIASMKPFTNDLDSGMVETSVEMRLEKVNLRELVELLKTIENSALMARTGRLRIKTRFDDPQLLDTTVLVTALETR
jgi:general secretion pathway protein M